MNKKKILCLSIAIIVIVGCKTKEVEEKSKEEYNPIEIYEKHESKKMFPIDSIAFHIIDSLKSNGVDSFCLYRQINPIEDDGYLSFEAYGILLWIKNNKTKGVEIYEKTLKSTTYTCTENTTERFKGLIVLDNNTDSLCTQMSPLSPHQMRSIIYRCYKDKIDTKQNIGKVLVYMDPSCKIINGINKRIKELRK
jgi:hypothetical protein